MIEKYKSPFTITEEITNLVIEIAEQTGVLVSKQQLSKNPVLRRENRIQSIHSSLSIEQNSLTINQVSDIIDGKKVLGPAKDIREVQNAYEAYHSLTKLDPYSVHDLLKAHGLMMNDLVREAGMFRSGGVGVFDGNHLIHAGTPPQYVPQLMDDLFVWMKESTIHPLIKSCIFHYEFEFIHPFSDGNGRVGRLWHTLLLADWKEFFLWLPIESLIHDQQSGYYEAINTANTQSESTEFVRFMLEIIKSSLNELIINIEYQEESLHDKLLNLIKENNKISSIEASKKLKISQRQVQRILKDLKEKGIIEKVGANKSGGWKVM
ncbi:Fic family protein [Tannockella kyphosi]|uniref:Fic family protein n=1 Tax=Tannockella kyphosi TaxID=2899121 RepID=UPI002011CB54|nr:Fic family protein [Tannockella kyphosi]